MGRWVRITCNRLTGCLNISGDCLGLLGTPSETLLASADPRPLLPVVVRNALDDPTLPYREDRQAGILLTATDTGSETVIVVAENREEIDSVYPDLPAGVVSIDHSGVIRHCNRVMAEMFGIDVPGCIGQEISSILPQPVLYSWNSVIKSVMMGHQVKVEFLPVAGRKNSGMLVRGGVGIVGLFHDITEVIETEKRLRAVQKMNQAIFSASEAGILMFDGKGRILLANRAMARITGLSNSLVGMHIGEVFPDECLKWVDRSSKRLLARPGKGATSGDMDWMSTSGETRVVRLSLQSITDDSGAVTHIMGYVDDITDQVIGMKRLETLGRSLDCMGRLTTILPGAGRQDSGSAGLIREILEADAIAIYINDPFSGFMLSESDGSWPERLLPDEFHGLRILTATGSDDSFRVLAGDKLGVLKGSFARGLVYNLGAPDNPMGYVVAAYSSDQAAMHREGSVGELAAALLTSGLLLHREHSESEKLAYLLRGRDRFLEDMFMKLPLPVFLFSESGEIILWNDDMTLMAGEDAFKQSAQRQQRSLDRILSGFGSISDLLRRFSRGESILQAPFAHEGVEGGGRHMLQIRKVRSIGRGTDESCFLAAVLPEDGSLPDIATSSRLLGILIDVYESLEPEQVMRKAALGALKLTGAEAVMLSIDRMGSVQVPSDSWPSSPDHEVEVTHKGGRLVFRFAGGVGNSHIELLGRAVLKITGRMTTFLSPSAIERITGVPGGLLMVTDSQGKVLFANWPEIVLGESGFISIQGILGESPPPDAATALRAAGKCTWNHPSEGLLRGMSLLGEPAGRTLWFPSGEKDGWSGGEERNDLSLPLIEFLLAYAQRVRSTLRSLGGMLSDRDTLRGLVNTLALDHGSAEDVLSVLRIASGAAVARVRPTRIEEVLRIAAGLLRNGGARVPNMAISEGLPGVVIDPEWIAGVVARMLLMTGEQGGGIAVTARERLVEIDMPLVPEVDEIPGHAEIAAALREGTLDHRIEAGIIASLLEQHGCRMERTPSGTLRLCFPVME